MTDLVTRTAEALGVDLFWYAVPPNDLVAALPFTMEITRGMRAYYGKERPGDRPNWRNRLNFASNRAMIAFNRSSTT